MFASTEQIKKKICFHSERLQIERITLGAPLLKGRAASSNLDSYLGYSAGLIREITHTWYIERYPKVNEANLFFWTQLI